MQHQKPSPPTPVFCAAAPSDAELLTQWETHLLPLQQAGQITVWSEQHLMAGTDRTQQIHEHLDQSQVILLLLSPDFFASNECIALMDRALAGQGHIIPLLLRPVDWKTSTLVDLACLPANGQFVTNWHNQDHAFHTCVHDLRQLIGLPTIPPQTRQQAGTSALQNQNRIRMLGRLRRSYNDLMSQSLQGAAWLELGLADKPDAVQNATNLLLRVPNRVERHLPPGTSITQAYDEAKHELLILGEPGAGKSTLLLDLAQQLVMRAEQDQTHPLPVILPLSSWAVKRPPLQDWLAEQLAQIYDVPRKLSAQWVQENGILPLLDGLDEMEETARPACIAAINAYHRDHLAILVVCSRTAEYEAATERHRLALQGAVIVQPLTHEHVDAYLVRAGKPLAALRSALKKNATLHDLATTPLMLNILTLTYQGTSVRGLPKREALLLQQVWDDYVQRMVARKERYPLDQTRSWLGWLARQMRDHNQTVFYLEHLQPDWLSTSQRRAYTSLAIRLPAIVIGVLTSILVQLFFFGHTDLPSLLQYAILGGLLGGLWHGSVSEKGNQGKHRHVWGKHLVNRLAVSACVGLIYGLSFGFYLDPDYTLSQWQIDGLSHGIAIGLGSLLLQYLLTTLPHSGISSGNSAPGRWKRLVRFFQSVQGPRASLVTVITGLGYGLSYLSYGLSLGLGYGLSYGLRIGLGYGLSFGLINLILGVQMGDIHLTEHIRWTWRSLSRGLFNPRHLRITVLLTCISMIFFGLSFGLHFGLSFGQTFGLNVGLSNGLIFGLSFGLGNGLSFGLNFWLQLGLSKGIAQEQIEDQDRRIANQGTYRSLHNSIMMGIISGTTIGSIEILSIGLSIGLSNGLIYGLSDGLSDGLSNHYGLNQGSLMGISSALLICILTGGLAAWRHYIIRFLLWRSHTFPGLALQFLDDATARFLLRRVGGGYSFAHRLLLDHFVGVETEAASSALPIGSI